MTSQSKTKFIDHPSGWRGLLLIMLALACFTFSPTAKAVVPPPDGGYPGFNTAEGQNALLSLTTGQANTATGWQSLGSNITGSFNTAIGAATLALNTADQNTATGAGALFLNATGDSNTANGALALLHNSGGSNNTASGRQALFSSTFGFNNTATGADALSSNTIGSSNTANGYKALFTNTTGMSNTAHGFQALYLNAFNSNSTAVGYAALSNSTGANNTALGSIAGQQVFTASNVICIGANVLGADVDDSCYIGNIHGQGIDVGTALTVGVDVNGKLGTTASSRRFKHDIKPMGKSSETILSLKPVTFHYNSDSKDTPQFGLIAEEVAEVTPELVVRDKKGGILSVRYDQVNAMLLNEFLKEHNRVEEQGTMIARQQKQIEELTAGLQKVSAQLAAASPSLGGLELSKAAPQAALNRQ